MLQDALIKLDPQESESVLLEINPKLQGGAFAPASVTILGQEVPFYPGYRFLDMADYETSPPVRAVAPARALRISAFSSHIVNVPSANHNAAINSSVCSLTRANRRRSKTGDRSSDRLAVDS